MTKQELIEKLEEIAINDKYDEESAHIHADYALLEYINDEAVTAAYDKVNKWYA